MGLTVAEAERLNNSSKIANAIANVVLLYDYNEKTKTGTHIPTEKITQITVQEDLFGHLPYVYITLKDTGTFFQYMGFEFGKQMLIKISPIDKATGEVPAKYFEGIFVISDFSYTLDQESNRYIYNISCTYNATGYINKIYRWPDKTISALNVEKQYTSKDVIKSIAEKSGLKFVSELSDTSDNMTWINTNKVCRDFIKHLVSHCWISYEDAPIYYIDKSGNFYLTSIKTLADKPLTVGYIEDTRYNAILASDSTSKPYYKAYRDIILDNMGFSNNAGGYKVKSYMYNPYSMNTLSVKEFNKHNIRGAETSTGSYRSFPLNDKKALDPFFPGKINKNTADMENVRYISNDTYFDQTHEYYDVAPLHNLNLFRSFFQVFTHLTVDTATQAQIDLNEGHRIKLGQKINIDFRSTKYENSVANGDFIICGLTHTWTQGASYTIMISCVRDTVTNAKRLEKQ